MSELHFNRSNIKTAVYMHFYNQALAHNARYTWLLTCASCCNVWWQEWQWHSERAESGGSTLWWNCVVPVAQWVGCPVCFPGPSQTLWNMRTMRQRQLWTQSDTVKHACNETETTLNTQPDTVKCAQWDWQLWTPGHCETCVQWNRDNSEHTDTVKHACNETETTLNTQSDTVKHVHNETETTVNTAKHACNETETKLRQQMKATTTTATRRL